MDRKQFYFRQLVTETELTDAIDAGETATTVLSSDLDFAQNVDGSGIPFATPQTGDFNALKGGIVTGLNVTIVGLIATVTVGAAYDGQGRRISTVTPLTIDLSATGDTATGLGGVPTGGFATTVPGGQTRWITLLMYFDRLLSDPRVDGNNTTVYFNEDESFHFRVKAGNAAASSPTRASLDTNTIVLGDFLRNDANAIATQDYSRRGDWLRMSSTSPATTPPVAQAEDGTTTDANFIQGSARNAIVKLRNMVTLATGNYIGHINQSAPVDRHAAKNIDFAAIPTAWADGTNPAIAAKTGGGSSTDGVQGALNELVADLGSKVSISGGQRIGATAISGSPITLPSTNLQDHNSILLTAINDHLNDTVAAHAATAISAATGGVRTTITVQGQLQDLDTNKMGLFQTSIFGNGSDGDVSLTSGTTTLTHDMFYNNLSVTNGAIIETMNHVIYVRDTLTINGTDGSFIIDQTTKDASTNVGATGGNQLIEGGLGMTLLAGSSGGDGGPIGTNGLSSEAITDAVGGNGGTGGNSAGSAHLGANPGSFGLLDLAHAGGINSSIMMHPGYLFGTAIVAGIATAKLFGIQGGSGGGGGAGGAAAGGGGGAGGGHIEILARKIVLQNGSEVTCKGGVGAPGAGTGAGGGGGGGGFIRVVTENLNMAISGTAVSGGVGGVGIGGGFSGSSGAGGTLNILVVET